MSINRENEYRLQRVIARDRGTELWSAIHMLATMEYEKIKEQMVTADAEQLMALQGRALGIKTALKWLTTTPLPQSD